VEREAERQAFAKACAYLNYNATAKWLALVAAVGTAIVYVALLVVLWLFADLMVYHGHLPTYRDLPPADQDRFRDQWAELTPAERHQRLQEVGFDDRRAGALAKEDPNNPDLPRGDLELLWRAQLHEILNDFVGPEAAELVNLQVGDYDQNNTGILSLVARSRARGRFLAPVVSWMARVNKGWMWRPAGTETGAYHPFLTGLLVVAVILTLLGAGLTLLMREAAARTTIEAATRLRRAVYHHTFRLGTLAFRALGPSEAVTIFTRHVEAVHDALYARLTVIFREPVKFGLLLAFALVVQFWLALAFFCFAVLVWLIGGQIAAYFRRRGRLATTQSAERLTVIRESLMLMRLVKCYLMELFNQSRVERQLSRYAKAQMVRYRGEAIYQPLLILLGMLCVLILLFVAGLIVLNGQLGVAGIIAMATALVSTYQPVVNFLATRKTMRRGREASVALFKFLERRGEVGQVVGAEFLPPLNKQIEFDNVSLREPGSTRMLLEEVTLTIPSGQRIGLIGADDLEKHALVYLIPRLLDPTNGEIRIDQHNLRWVTLDSLRAQIGVVLQHDLVFHDTVANNIGCGDAAYTLPQIIEAAKIAHAHHFIQKLPQGYETPIGELGHPLGLSEKLRIALARLVLRDPALLIIEEPEAALDEDTKSLLDDTFARILPGRTAIFLPHRISTIRSCDRLYLLHKGRIEAAGIHKELLSQNQLYRHLHYLEFNEMAEVV
jgi:ATP-binding cassette subfamily B protein